MAKEGRYPLIGGGGGGGSAIITYATSGETEDKTLTNVAVNPAGLANFEKTYQETVADTQNSPITILKTLHKINYVSDIQVFEVINTDDFIEVETENSVDQDGNVIVSFIENFNGKIIINGR